MLFIAASLMVVIPFVHTSYAGAWDVGFHLNRLLELVSDTKVGHFPDVSYFSFNHQGYGVNFFYPWFINYPTALLWLFSKKIIFSLLVSTAIYYFIGLNIAFDAFYHWRGDKFLSTGFAIFFVLGMSKLSTNIIQLTEYNNQIATLFLPWALMGIYQVVVGNDKKWSLRMIVGVSIILLTHVLTALFLVACALIVLISKLIVNFHFVSISRLKTWLKCLLMILGLTAVFVFPFLQQRLSNNWLSEPAQNLLTQGVVTGSIPEGSAFSKLGSALDFSQPINLLFLVVLIILIVYRVFTPTLLKMLWMIVAVGFVQSEAFPWWWLQQFALFNSIQSVNRLDGIWYCLLCFFCFEGIGVLKSKRNINVFSRNSQKYSVVIILSLSGLLLVNDTMQTIAGRTNVSVDNKWFWVMNNKNLDYALSHSNYLSGAPDSGDGFYGINGFLDYRSKKQVLRKTNFPLDINDPANIEKQVIGGDQRIGNNLAFKIIGGNIRRQNRHLVSPISNWNPDRQVDATVFSENAVNFDNRIKLGVFSHHGLSFSVKKIPLNCRTVQTPITYLNGFKGINEKGQEVQSYRNKNGFLAFHPNGSKRIKILYAKTSLQKGSIILSGIVWVCLIFCVFLHIMKHFKRLQKS